ncbi:MAG: TldD/PmbA family protein [Bacteroidetes bacterium]|nr:TldD/PmbA family protein [Bacteroidota bacterium]
MSAIHQSMAREALSMAIKKGCSAARVCLSSGVQSSYTVRDTLLEKVHQAAGNTLQLQLFAEGRYGTFSTNRLERDALQRFIEQAIAGIRLLAPDPARTLPDPARYYKGHRDLALFDPALAAMSGDEKSARAFTCAREVWGKDSRLISVESEYGDGIESCYLIDSQGFEATTRQTVCSLTAEVALRDAGDARPSAWWYESALFLQELPVTGCGTQALERASAKLQPKTLPSGDYPMVVEHTVAAQLLAPLMAALNGAAIQQNNSFLIHKLGEKIGSDLLAITDDPLIRGAQGARLFDAEGVATRTTPILCKGILNTYFIDTYHAHKLQMPPTIGGPSLLIWEGGSGGAPELMQALQKGIFVTGFNGGNCNSSTGDFSYGIEGFAIVDGMVGAPVSEMIISGNMLELWSRLCAVANDARTCSSWRIPSLAFNNVSFSGI